MDISTFKGRDFLTLLDYTPEEITALLSLAAKLKAQKKAGIPHDGLRGKNVALIFEKTSTRTRCSFEVAAHDLGMGTTYLDPAGSQIGKVMLAGCRVDGDGTLTLICLTQPQAAFELDVSVEAVVKAGL